MTIRKVGVVGCGLMGAGIAQVSAQAGFKTVVREVSAPLLEKGLGSIRKFTRNRPPEDDQTLVIVSFEGVVTRMEPASVA